MDLKLPGPGWTVLAGRNGSGKTTFLRALAQALVQPPFAESLVTGGSSIDVDVVGEEPAFCAGYRPFRRLAGVPPRRSR
ncbi:AAA family ATPase [Amycolatopsis sp. NPDC023774]|uniref:AAA family ATPase n=1 Tax=Amycolatopsis sp. NPDC023774 TaxID=3155015 RepID=UPI0033D8F304